MSVRTLVLVTLLAKASKCGVAFVVVTLRTKMMVKALKGLHSDYI